MALAADIPVVFGVLTTDTAEQAMSRADLHGANYGREFADSALAMVALFDDCEPG